MSSQTSATTNTIPILLENGENLFQWSDALSATLLERVGSAELTKSFQQLQLEEVQLPAMPRNAVKDSPELLLHLENLRSALKRREKLNEGMLKALGLMLNTLSPGFRTRLDAHKDTKAALEKNDAIAIFALIKDIATGKTASIKVQGLIEKAKIYKLVQKTTVDAYIVDWNRGLKRLSELGVKIDDKDYIMTFLLGLDQNLFGDQIVHWVSSDLVPATFEETKTLVTDWLAIQITLGRMSRGSSAGKGSNSRSGPEEVAHLAHNRGCYYCNARGRNGKSHTIESCRSLKAVIDKEADKTAHKESAKVAFEDYFCEDQDIVF